MGTARADYQRLVFDKLSKLPNIPAYRSTLVMRTVNRTAELPVQRGRARLLRPSRGSTLRKSTPRRR